jgi:DNA-binding response OmpR family regulator
MPDARLLIVEDNEEIAQMLTLFLGARGYKVSLAPDGATALRTVREFLPHLILLDVGLPDIDGYEVLQRFRGNARTSYIPVIFLTQRTKKMDKIAGLKLGADDFITKPFDLEELFLRVQNAVARADREKLTDPHTGLPAGRAVREQVETARARGRAAVQYRMKNLSEFRDQYGMLAGTDLLRYTALMLNRVLNTLGAEEDFLGQTDEETFVVVAGAERSDLIRKTVTERFANDAVQHYALAERVGEDKVKVKTPLGQEYVLPMVRLDATALT